MSFDPLTGALDLGAKLVDRLIPDPAAKAQAAAQLLQLKASGELARMTADTDLARAQIEEGLHQICQRLMDAGVTINRPPRDGRMAFVRSPDNVSVELLQKGGAKPPQEPWASMASTGVW